MVVKNEDDTYMPLVTLSHVMCAIREGMPMKMYDEIRELPQMARVVLCVAVSLSEIWGPAIMTISILKKYCHQAFLQRIMDEWGLENFPYLIQLLVDSSLLIADDDDQFSAYDMNAKLKSGVHLDDIEIAFGRSLLEEGGFYYDLVKYIKRECPHPPC